jgi:uncharacterized protein involved in exopolysaccharide biosynthesis
MKRILKLIARLYPSDWRSRYATEYEALLEDAAPRPQDAVDVLWGATRMQLTSRSFIRIVLPCTIAGALIAAAISFAIPPRYISQTLITVTESAPVTEADRKQVLLNLRDTTLDRGFLSSVIEKHNLYPTERATMPLDKVIDKMLQSIEVRRVQPSPEKAKAGTTSGFAIDFVYSDPHLAQQVENELISQFVKANLLRREHSASVRSPLTGEIFRVADAPDFPTSPTFPRRGIFALGGLIAGLLCGFILAAILGPRYNTIAKP